MTETAIRKTCRMLDDYVAAQTRERAREELLSFVIRRYGLIEACAIILIDDIESEWSEFSRLLKEAK